MPNFNDVVSQFRIKGTAESVSLTGNGLISETLYVKAVNANTPDYTLQRINNAIFTDVDLLQHNIELVTDHIRRKLIEKGETDIERKCLRFVQAKDGKTYYKDADNLYWRVSVSIPNAATKEEVNPESAFCCGETFGNFQNVLVDLKEPLGETIPDFHNMELRLRQLREAVSADKAGRVASVKGMIAELKSYADKMCLAGRLYREGALPKRICHCDTKVNNMMLDKDGKMLCVIDLDTIMPSFTFSDYGDFLRTGANHVAEDSDSYDAVGLKEDVLCSFTEGYSSTAGNFLTPVETSHLSYTVALFPYMRCIRFLTDYIDGDVYFKVKYPEHNFVRSRNQPLLYRNVRRHGQMMTDFVRKTLKQ